MDAWYLIQTKPRRERTALENLERQGYQSYLPLVRLRRRLRGRHTRVVEPLFPGYLFLLLSDETDDWGPIRSTVGVARLVAFGGLPARVPHILVAAMREREDADGIHVLAGNPLTPGERVQIVDGAMSGFEAIYEAHSGRDRVVLLLHLAERELRVHLSEDAVERI